MVRFLEVLLQNHSLQQFILPHEKQINIESVLGECLFKVGLGILQFTSAKRCPQVWPWVGRSLSSTNFVEFDQAV